MEKQNEMLAAALEYIRIGFAIIPLAKDKTPLIKGWQKNYTTDPAVAQSWWIQWPDANVGIVTGEPSGGLYVIDIDVDEEKGIDGSIVIREWERDHGHFPKSWCSRTGRGGVHYFFLSNEQYRNRVGIMPGIDVRGDGGFVVAPPSIHKNGNRYHWQECLSPDDLVPANINDTIRFFLSTGSTEKHPEYVSPEKIPQGERNNMLFKLACSLQAKGLSDKAIRNAVITENEEKCSPSLPSKDIDKIIASALKYEKGKPIFAREDGTVAQGWREPEFTLNKDGKIQKTRENIKEAIFYDKGLYGIICHNILTNSLWVKGHLPWDHEDVCRRWRNEDDASLKEYLEKKYRFDNSEKIMDALSVVAIENAFNPVVDELKAIYETHKDKCAGSIRKLLPEYMGADDTDYTFEVLKLYMLGAIKRAFEPGCKFDTSLILYGMQGMGKSEFLRHLAINPEWFNDNFSTFDGDKAIEKLTGMWIIEMAELKALKSAKDAESFKSFLTSRVDTFRAPYARRPEQRPRMCVFAGTTNNKNVFVDKTGNRRFLPVECNKLKIKKDLFGDQDKVKIDFELAWAEAMTIFFGADQNPNLVLPKEMQKIAEEMQEEFSEDDYRVGMIQNWLDNTNVDKVCVPQLIEFALNDDINKASKKDKREVQEIMDNEVKGWSRVKNKDKGRMNFGKYGKQIAFLKDSE